MPSSLTFALSPRAPLALLAALGAISYFLARSVPKLLPLSPAVAGRLSALAGPLKWAFDYSLRFSVLGHSHSHVEPGAFGTVYRLGVARYGGGPPAECAVCLCEVGVGEEVRELNCCDHVFHRACLDRWLSYKNGTCPLCRRFVARRSSVGAIAEVGPAVISLAFFDLGSGGDREAWWLR